MNWQDTGTLFSAFPRDWEKYWEFLSICGYSLYPLIKRGSVWNTKTGVWTPAPAYIKLRHPFNIFFTRSLHSVNTFHAYAHIRIHSMTELHQPTHPPVHTHTLTSLPLFTCRAQSTQRPPLYVTRHFFSLHHRVSLTPYHCLHHSC